MRKEASFIVVGIGALFGLVAAAMSPAEAQAPAQQFVYSVKFVCGLQNHDSEQPA
jgi:hypothetical protein